MPLSLLMIFIFIGFINLYGFVMSGETASAFVSIISIIILVFWADDKIKEGK